MRVFIKTIGCSANFSDSEIMAGLLVEAGHELVDSADQADRIIFNVCTVKGESTALREIRKLDKDKLIMAGCVTPKLRVRLDVPALDTYSIQHVVDFLERKDIKSEPVAKINYPKVKRNPVIAIVPILSGCLSACSYCSVRLIKGKLSSYPEHAIIEEVKKAVASGCKEVWLTSQDNAVYGLDIGSNLVDLVRKVVAIPGDFMVRIGMMNPKYALPILDGLIELYRHEKIYKFLHLPVQSGSDRILKDMNRDYQSKDFLSIINKFQKEIHDITISTDIICGFPGETDREFEESIELTKKIKPAVLNISRFMPREGTVAAEMKQLPGGVVKERSRALTRIFDEIALEQNNRWLNWQGTVLIDEKGKDGSWVGRNYAYRPVIVRSKKNLLGKKVEVKIKKVTKHDLRASTS